MGSCGSCSLAQKVPTSTTHATLGLATDKTHRGHAIIEQVHADLKNFGVLDQQRREAAEAERLAAAGIDAGR
jgi:hypothetical protein